ncbi:histone H3-like [Platysternon megacephalum]|uniref:Histone H3-like n=1 Tax=Platysternon megacephalum TaxID=55544 RepID=A0A4D9DNI8_9SAUR|nr:histone H3-like [Platysternon megacephalum]
MIAPPPPSYCLTSTLPFPISGNPSLSPLGTLPQLPPLMSYPTDWGGHPRAPHTQLYMQACLLTPGYTQPGVLVHTHQEGPCDSRSLTKGRERGPFLAALQCLKAELLVCKRVLPLCLVH